MYHGYVVDRYITKAESYKTSDGSIFLDVENARKHQRQTDFVCRFANMSDTLYSPDGHVPVQAEEMYTWLMNNRMIVEELYK